MFPQAKLDTRLVSLTKGFNSFQLPVLEGQPNVTALDLQIKKLRDAAVASIRQVASRMRDEATDVKATVGEIEDWLDRVKQLADEVGTETTIVTACSLTLYRVCESNFSAMSLMCH